MIRIAQLQIVIELDINRLLHDAIVSNLADIGAINKSGFNRGGYRDGLAIDFGELNTRFENGRLVIYTTRKAGQL